MSVIYIYIDAAEDATEKDRPAEMSLQAVSFSEAISACEKHGQWQRVLWSDEMRRGSLSLHVMHGGVCG
eukprot:6143474-Karenia_brevis.AAC.1